MNSLRSRNRISLVMAFVAALFFLSRSNAASLPDFTGMVEAYGPAVVNISTKQTKSLSSRLPPQLRIPDLPENNPFSQFFRHYFGDPEEIPHHFDSRSLGSGFIISEDGYLLTNHHVVADADEIIVRLSDRREHTATVVGSDERSDVALLKIDAEDLPVVKIIRNRELKVGAWVVAIGSPFGFDHSVTAGIVSAKGRSLPSENYVPFIQTDVAINPGNSGGPLFNLDGEVVGINSQIYSRTGGFMGLSFAIPIDVAMNVADQLRTKGHVSRGWLGVLIQDVTRELAESFGLSRPRGALVAKVLPDSPAEKGGLEAGDIILSYNGEQLRDSSMLPPLVGVSTIDRPAKLDILRRGEKRTVEVVIGELPEEEGYEMTGKATPEGAHGNRLGLAVTDLSGEEREQMGLENDSGVLVQRVTEGPAMDAGIRKGDVIQMVNNVWIRDLDSFQEQLKALPKGRSVAVLVHRHSGPIFLALHIPEGR